MKRLFALSVLLLTLAAAADAQVRVVRYGEDRLTGVRDVDVLVTTNASPAPCALDVPAVQHRAAQALRAANITATISEKGRSWYHSVVIDIYTTRTDHGCASAIATELVAEVAAMPEADRDRPAGTWGSLLVGAMPLVRDKALVIGGVVEHDSAVQQAIEADVAAIAARIRASNP